MGFTGIRTLLGSLSLAAALASAIAPRLALAWNPGEENFGKVHFIQLGAGGSVGFVLVDSSGNTVKLCNGAAASDWGDIAQSAAGKKEMLAALMMAKATGLWVKVYTVNQPAGTPGCCPVAFIDLDPPDRR